MSLTEPSLPPVQTPMLLLERPPWVRASACGFQPRRTVQPWDTRFADFLSQIFTQTPQNRAVTVRTYD